MMAQKVEYNKEGERIIRFSDGSWRYYEPADSVYLNNSAQEDTKVQQEPTEELAKASPEMKAKIEASKQQIEAVRKEIIYLMERRVDINDQLLKVEETKKKLELNTELQKVIHREKEQKRLYQDLKAELKNLKTIAATSQKEQAAYLEGSDETIVEQGEIQYDKGREIQSIPDHIYHVPSDCLVNKSKDKFSGRTRTQVHPSIFFEHTPKVMQSYLDDKSFITTYCSVFHVQGRYFLNLIVEVSSDKARQTYGYISKGGQLMLQLVNGDVYTLKSSNNAIGSLKNGGKLTRYDVIYSLDPRLIDELQNHPLNKVRLVWSTGYEDYDIYIVDVLKDQLTCLQSNL
jgi:hypothetical protein